MSTCTPVIRGGPLPCVFALLAIALPASVSGAAPRYSVHASLHPAIVKTTARGSGLSMQGRLDSSRSYLPVHEGTDLALIGKLSHIVLGCADDTIFVNGFDALGAR